jgi:hypothetical protein
MEMFLTSELAVAAVVEDGLKDWPDRMKQGPLAIQKRD